MAEDTRSDLLRQVLDRLKSLEGLRSDVELAEPLATNRRNIAAWKERGTLPWDRLYDYCQRRQISLEWLLNGRGASHVTQLVAEPGAVYKVDTHQDVLYRIASDIYRALRQSDTELSPEKFAQVMRLLHRDMLDSRSQQIAYEKILEVVKLAG
jgi:Bacteriophage CI repressor helix-turn-helix domain